MSEYSDDINPPGTAADEGPAPPPPQRRPTHSAMPGVIGVLDALRVAVDGTSIPSAPTSCRRGGVRSGDRGTGSKGGACDI